MKDIMEYLEIPYIKLKIHIIFSEQTSLPENKVSALRGGMGEMLLRENCINNRECASCCFEEECIVRRTLYTRMDKKPAFMQGNDSIGYLIECENYETEFGEGDGLYFSLILFGRNLVYFSQYLEAFYQLGINGLGKCHSRFYIHDIYTATGMPVLTEGEVRMDNYRYEMVSQYVQRRMQKLQKMGCKNSMRFITPLSLKYKGEYIQQFQTEAIWQALSRRIQMMNYFVDHYYELIEFSECPEILFQKNRRCVVKRYSSTQDSKINLVGIKGEIQFEAIPETYLPFLIAGELFHIGKNSSFGFGKYIVS